MPPPSPRPPPRPGQSTGASQVVPVLLTAILALTGRREARGGARLPRADFLKTVRAAEPAAPAP